MIDLYWLLIPMNLSIIIFYTIIIRYGKKIKKRKEENK